MLADPITAFFSGLTSAVARITCAFVAILLVGFFGVRGCVDHLTGRDRRIDRGFSRVRIGMATHDVQRLMRSPGERLEEFRIGQEGGFEKQYAEAAGSESSYWLSWTQFDIRYTVGFDESDRVTYKAAGGT